MNYVLSASESHNRANVRRSTDESAADFAKLVEIVRAIPQDRRPKIVGGISTALGCTIEGQIPLEKVRSLALRLAEAGADELILADTVGYANPAAVRRMFEAVQKDVGALPITAHFHDTRGLGLSNVLAALDVGIRGFDASLGGLGGCPYAPGASGNISTEDVVFMLESMGYRTGVDLEKLLAVRKGITEALGDQPFHGAIANAGLPKGFVPAHAH